MSRANEPQTLSEVETQHMQATLAILKGHLERAYNDLDKIDDKARTFLLAASLFITFSTSYQLADVNHSSPLFYWILLAIALILYGTMLVVLILVIKPGKYVWAVNAEWEDVVFYWELEDEKSLMEQMTSDYIQAIQQNTERVESKARWLSRSIFIFGIIIIDLALMALIKTAPFAGH